MYAQVFSLGGLCVLPFWFAMIFLPWWSGIERMMRGLLGWIGILVPALAYVVLVIPQLGGLGPALLRPELSQIAGMLGQPAGATIGWMHFLAFDLFVGRWIFLDSRERGIASWWVSPTLFFTLMIGPAGLLLYLVVRALFSRVKSKEPTQPAT